MNAGGFPEDTSALDAWTAAHVPGFVGPSVATKFATGQSNPTYLIANPSGRYVLRRKPLGKLLKSAHMVEREFRVMRALNGEGYPAPRALALCEDESVAGSVFFLMSHVEGRILWDPSLPDSTREERAGVYDSMNEALARLHGIDVVAAGLSDYGKPGNYFARQWQRWSEQYRASETSEIPEMHRLIDWLGANMPPDDGRVALVHGDYRIDNMIFHPTEPRVAAVLDWELSTLGDPLADLGTALAYWHDAGDAERALIPVAAGVTAWPGFPSAAEFAACYAAASGRELGDLSFYLALGTMKLAVILEGVHTRYLAGQGAGPGYDTAGAAVPVLVSRGLRQLRSTAM
jgi:aminoglycoside phosphotransferase (APT) family kinase protein